MLYSPLNLANLFLEASVLCQNEYGELRSTDANQLVEKSYKYAHPLRKNSVSINIPFKTVKNYYTVSHNIYYNIACKNYM